jgi:hypothetical protein
MCSEAAVHEFEIGERFRRTMEARIALLESGAAHDEAMLECLDNEDHIRRQMRLVAVQRKEAERIRKFLDKCRTRGGVQRSY